MTLPLFADGVQLTVAEAFAAVAETPAGAAGTAAGTTALEGADGGPDPAAFVAVTVNV
jgi:hypothetical protein